MPKVPRTKLHEWFLQATEEERQKFVKFTDLSFHYIRAIAYGHREGPLAVLIRMAWAARKVNAMNLSARDEPLPDIQRGDVSPLCANCPFYQACRKAGMSESHRTAEEGAQGE